MMDKELVQQSQSEPATNGPAPSTPTTPTPPRLIPNPMLLDSPAPTLTPTTSSPPPPLTPAPSVSSGLGSKVASVGGALSPHILVPAPPKLTSTAAPALRTYSRPILPSPTTKAPPSTPASSSSSAATAAAAPALPSSSSAVTHISTTPSTSLTNGNSRPGPTSTPITPFHTPASPPGRQVQQPHPVGTPGPVRANQSPSPVRQRVSQQALLLGKGLKGSGQDQVLLRAQMLILTSAMRPAQSPSSSSSAPSSNPASAQLQSLTLRPPPPGTLTIPPSLRLKPPPSAPPPLSRPTVPVFPPLRPRPQPGATESPTTPSRHLAVPPPTLYSPVRAVPLRPRLHSPTAHRVSAPRHSAALQPIAAAPCGPAAPAARPPSGPRSCPPPPAALGPPPSAAGRFERSPSAARQLQIIALSSNQQPPAAAYARPAAPSKPAEPPPPPPPPGQSKRTLSKDDGGLLPLNPSSSPLTLTKRREAKESEERGGKAGLREERGGAAGAGRELQVEKEVQTETVKLEKPAEEQEAGPKRARDRMEEEEAERRGTGKKRRVEEEGEDASHGRPGPLQNQNTEPGPGAIRDAEPVPVKTPLKGTVPVQTPGTEPDPVEPAPVPGPVPFKALVKGPVSAKTQAKALVPVPIPVTGPAPVKGPASTQTSATEPVPVEAPVPGPVPVQTPVPGPVPVKASVKGPVLTQVPGPVPVQTPASEPAPANIPVKGPASTQTPVPAPVPVQTPVLGPVPVKAPLTVPLPTQKPVAELVPAHKPVTGHVLVQSPAPGPVSEVSGSNQRLPEPQRDLQPSQEDFCENLSTQSDNQSALSSLSSQSPPSSPFVVSSSENPPPLLPADLSLPQHEAPEADKTPPESRRDQPEPVCQSEDESESCGQSLGSPWEMKAWPEGRQVLTHLVEGFVIQEGLQPFPVNRSSLLVPDQVSKTQEVNGTNGRAALPAADPVKPAAPSTDSEEEDGGDEGDLGNKSGHRDRTVLHCQFCGKRGHAHNFMRSKRFCSTSCARGFNVRLTKRLRALSAGSRTERPRPALNRAESVPGKPLLLRLPRDLWSAGRRDKDGKEKPAAEQKDEDEDVEASPHVFGGAEEDDDDGGEEDPAVAMAARMERRAARRARRASAPAVSASTPTTTFRPAPSQWSVEEVTAFIHALPGCGDVAEAFRLQEIDGQALLLLTEDHLMTSMNIKLGPALKICAHINALKNQ
ncbi:nascent polypeptide-associated complex subunit alpha, muscle-specific form-like isoform X2 [Fundulus heteroclitus]|uniref:nascent polypeptide-associated complex subunit alpha, muscle-specific form-like isoform X2 n=1 Tax=Fundulus heteroclitus TaxID=8078 RepID=UPI00165BF858|nr:nascent polypeptide-associated complex subunit alpha, muscle-specific form-like isoform X2 [Fundulus heteroclitus]